MNNHTVTDEHISREDRESVNGQRAEMRHYVEQEYMQEVGESRFSSEAKCFDSKMLCSEADLTNEIHMDEKSETIKFS